MASSVKTISRSTNATVGKQRKIQHEQDGKDASKSKKTARKSTPAVQTSEKKQAASPMSRKHLLKPGIDAELDVAPQFLASRFTVVAS